MGWQAPADNGAAVSDFQLECDDGSGGPFRRVFTGMAGKHAISGLKVRISLSLFPVLPYPPEKPLPPLSLSLSLSPALLLSPCPL